ncbi:MAG: hypothetical protein HXY50_02690 [Ignavibacteriaceae bacterium]|nr:hypothetical protein [Ignavibacteriaceae bacterium]
MNKYFQIYLLCFVLLTSNQVIYNQSQNFSTNISKRFSLKQFNDQWWLVTPEGKPFFSRGVCCVNTGLAFDEYNQSNPGYAAWHHFENPAAWARNTVDSLTSWGYTTIGGWSSMEHFLKLDTLKMYFTPVLAMGATAGMPWFDMWDSSVVERMDRIAKDRILKVKDSPNLIGYYSDNELGWWNAALWNMTLKDKPSSISRQKTIDLIFNHYEGNWEKLLNDFEPSNAANFEELRKSGHLYFHAGGNGITVVKKFISMIADRYYSLMKETIRKYDNGSLFLGDRYQAFYYNEVVKSASKYVDVVSTNLNASWNDGTMCRFFLSNLYKLSEKPVAIGEYYMAANENRSGNKNSSASFPTVHTQEDRVKGFLATSKLIAQTPFIVMADWFQYYDEPMHGRDDGENFNMGLIDIFGNPYHELVLAAKNFNWEGLKFTSNFNSNSSNGIPPAPKSEIVIRKDKEILKNWDRLNGFVESTSPLPSADMYLCWDEDSLFIGIYSIDVVEKEYYKDNFIPEVDRMELMLRLDNSSDEIKIRLGSGRKP